MTSTDPEPSAGFDQEPPAPSSRRSPRARRSRSSPPSPGTTPQSLRARRNSSPTRPPSSARVIFSREGPRRPDPPPTLQSRRDSPSTPTQGAGRGRALETQRRRQAPPRPRLAPLSKTRARTGREEDLEERRRVSSRRMSSRRISSRRTPRWGRVPDVELEDRPASRTDGTIGTRGWRGRSPRGLDAGRRERRASSLYDCRARARALVTRASGGVVPGDLGADDAKDLVVIVGTRGAGRGAPR